MANIKAFIDARLSNSKPAPEGWRSVEGGASFDKLTTVELWEIEQLQPVPDVKDAQTILAEELRVDFATGDGLDDLNAALNAGDFEWDAVTQSYRHPDDIA